VAGTQDHRSALAAAVWMTTGAYCAAIAAAAMLASLIVEMVTDFDVGNAIGSVIWSIVFIGSAAVVGWVVGAIVGVPLGLVVTVAHGRLGTRAVAVLLSLVALLMTVVVVYGWLGTRSHVAIGVAAFLALIGGLVIGRRYERLARERPLH
jgi:hypothetical protein